MNGRFDLGGRVAVLGRRGEKARRVAKGVEGADVRDGGQLEEARKDLPGRLGRVDVLVNAAGGNVPAAVVGEDESFFGLSGEAFGEPEGLVGAVVGLCGPGARFVNGAVAPVDGGFGVFGGV